MLTLRADSKQQPNAKQTKAKNKQRVHLAFSVMSSRARSERKARIHSRPTSFDPQGRGCSAPALNLILHPGGDVEVKQTKKNMQFSSVILLFLLSYKSNSRSFASQKPTVAV